VFLLAALLLVTLRHKLRRCCRHPAANDADWDDAELGGMP
jgi:hypothetical protein